MPRPLSTIPSSVIVINQTETVVQVGTYFTVGAGDTATLNFAALKTPPNSSLPGRLQAWITLVGLILNNTLAFADGTQLNASDLPTSGGVVQDFPFPRQGQPGITAFRQLAITGTQRVAAVHCFALLPGNRLVIGGAFTAVNGIPRTNVAMVDALSGQVLPWDPGFTCFNTTVDSTEFVIGLWYAPGFIFMSFYTNSSQVTDPNNPSNHYTAVVALDPDTALINAPDFGFITGRTFSNYYITNVSLFDNTIYMGGYFDTLTGAVTRHGACAFSFRTWDLLAWDVDVSPGIQTGALYDMIQDPLNPGSLLVAGDFSTIGGQTINGFARVDKVTGTVDPTFDPNVADTINSSPFGYQIVQVGNNLFLGGSFTTIDSNAIPFVAKTSLAGAVDITFNPGFDGTNDYFSFLWTGNNRLVLSGDFFYGSGTGGNTTGWRMVMTDVFGNVLVRGLSYPGTNQEDDKLSPLAFSYLGGDFGWISSANTTTFITACSVYQLSTMAPIPTP
jgi:hypothetical protein